MVWYNHHHRVDKDGETGVKIECMVDEDEKEHVWDLLRFKHKRDCCISSEASGILSDTSSEITTDVTTIPSRFGLIIDDV